MKPKLWSEQKFDAHLAWLDANCACFFDLGGDSPAAPDYTPVANASKESAQIMADLGQKQLDESRRQYDTNVAVAKPIVDSQLATMQQTAAQGQDYYDYMVSQQRPVEGALNTEAMAAGSDGRQQEQVDRAVADSNGGFTRSINQAMREGKRYGIDAIANTGAMAVQQASNTAAAATGARDKEKALGFAKKLDVAGLYRGLPGASQGAYSASTNAGNSANQNNMAPGQQLMTGMEQGSNTIGNGRTVLQNGLGGILNSQTSAYNAGANASGSKSGALLGAAATLGAAYFTGGASLAASSKKIKTNKRDISPVLNGVRNLDVQSWKYNQGVADGGEHIGPYAEDVQREFGNKVAPKGKAIDVISMLGVSIKATQELADKVDSIEKRLPKRGRVIEGESRRV